MPKRRYAVYNEVTESIEAQGLSRSEAVHLAANNGIGAMDVVSIGENAWELSVGPDSHSLQGTGYIVTAERWESAMRGCTAIASVRRIWGRCVIVPDDDVGNLMAKVVA